MGARSRKQDLSLPHSTHKEVPCCCVSNRAEQETDKCQPEGEVRRAKIPRSEEEPERPGGRCRSQWWDNSVGDRCRVQAEGPGGESDHGLVGVEEVRRFHRCGLIAEDRAPARNRSLFSHPSCTVDVEVVVGIRPDHHGGESGRNCGGCQCGDGSSNLGLRWRRLRGDIEGPCASCANAQGNTRGDGPRKDPADGQ